MTPQEAITELLTDKLCLMAVASHPSLVNVEEIGIAISALEKQTPKKLICIEIEKCCPVCKEGICLIGDDGNYGNYCSNCGQALDWSDTE